MNSTKTSKTNGRTRLVRQAGGSTGVNLVINPVISNEQGKDLIVVKTNGKRQTGHIRGHLEHRYPVLVNQVMTST
jgi:hypothetical protein